MITRLFFLLCIFFSFPLNAMEEKKEISLSDYVKKNRSHYTTYEGITINGSNLYLFSEKMPDSLKKNVEEWSTKNKSFLHIAISHNDMFNLSSYPSEQELKDLSKLIASYKFENKSENNIVIPLTFENENWFAKFAGPTRRWSTLTATARELGTKSLWQLKTQQTASSVAYYLYYKALFEKEKIKHIKLPPTYLAHVPGRSPLEEGVSDENCFTVQAKINTFARLKNNPEYLAELPNEAVYDLFQVILKGPLFDLRNNLAFDICSKDLIIADLEQSWQESSSDFFQKNSAAIEKKITQSTLGFLSLVHKGVKTYRAQGVKRIYETFCAELEKYPMIEKSDPCIEWKRMDIENELMQMGSLENKNN